MSTDEFTKLFKYMTERFDRIDAEIAKKSDSLDVQKIPELIDDLVKR